MSASLSSMIALVADASPLGSRMARDVLLRSGFRRVVEVRDGAEALSALSDHKPDLMVLDWNLPVIAARQILAMARDRERSHAPAMPVVVTMPEPTRSAVEAALALAASAVVAVPCSPGELRRRLGAALASRPLGKAGTAAPR